jgi:hypothetical protein
MNCKSFSIFFSISFVSFHNVSFAQLPEQHTPQEHARHMCVKGCLSAANAVPDYCETACGCFVDQLNKREIQEKFESAIRSGDMQAMATIQQNVGKYCVSYAMNRLKRQ